MYERECELEAEIESLEDMIPTIYARAKSLKSINLIRYVINMKHRIIDIRGELGQIGTEEYPAYNRIPDVF